MVTVWTWTRVLSYSLAHLTPDTSLGLVHSPQCCNQLCMLGETVSLECARVGEQLKLQGARSASYEALRQLNGIL